MNRKKISIISTIVALLILLLLFTNIYSDSSFEMPKKFRGLSDFVTQDCLLYIEFPSFSNSLTKLKQNQQGRKFLQHPLMRELFINKIETKTFASLKKISKAVGFTISSKQLLGLLSKPAAIAIYNNRGQTELVGSIKLNNANRFFFNLTGKAAAIFMKKKKIQKIQWQKATIYRIRRNRTTFACTLLNNFFLFSSSEARLKKAIRNAALPTKNSPPFWYQFIFHNPLTQRSFFRAYARSKYVGQQIPLGTTLASSIFSSKACYLSAELQGKIKFKGGYFLKKDTRAKTFSPNLFSFTPRNAVALFAGADSVTWDTLHSAQIGPFLNTLPKDYRIALINFFLTLDKEVVLSYKGIKTKGRALYPSFTFLKKIQQNKRRVSQTRLNMLLALLPGLKKERHTYLDKQFYIIKSSTPHSFTPCYAFLGNYFAFTLDQASMHDIIHQSKGNTASLKDSRNIKKQLRAARITKISHIAHLNLKKVLYNLYTRMGNYAFHSRQFSRRQVFHSFRPIFKKGLPFKKLSIIVGEKKENHMQALFLLN